MSKEMKDQQVETPDNGEKRYRTEVNASRVHSDLALVPEKLFLPSNDRYMGGFDYRTNEDYYLEMIKGIDVCFDESNGELTFNGIPASRVDLTDIETKQKITELNTPLLHGLFSVIWFNLIKDIDKVSPIPTKQDEEKYYRVNSDGLFNVPFGKKTHLNLCDEDNIRDIAKKMHSAKIMTGDFEKACRSAEKGDFVFFDSPYYDTFDTYQAGGFSEADHVRLAKL